MKVSHAVHNPDLSSEKEALLSILLASKGVDNATVQRIPLRIGASTHPLSFAQERMWFMERLHPGTATYNMPMAFRLSGEVDVAALAQALNAIVDRHPALRTVFREIDEQPTQIIPDRVEIALRQVDLSALAEEERQTALKQLMDADDSLPFDLENGPLLRAALLACGGGASVLLLTMHHIVSDGLSVEIILRELGILYASFHSGQPASLTALPVRYADFSAWERLRILDEDLAISARYWRQQLSGATPLLLPSSRRNRAAPRSNLGQGVSVVLPPDLLRGLKALCVRERSTLFMAGLAAFSALLQRASGQSDVVVGTPIGNRYLEELEPLVGLFVNTLAMRTAVRDDADFLALLASVRKTALAAFSHQHLPFDRVIADLEVGREAGAAPLVSAMFVLSDAASFRLNLEGLGTEAILTESTVAKLDVVMSLLEDGDRMIASLQFSSDLFERAAMRTLLENFGLFLKVALDSPAAPLSRLWEDVETERARMASNATSRVAAYWESQPCFPHDLPMKCAPDGALGQGAASHLVRVDPASRSLLEQFAFTRQSSLRTVLHAALSILIARHSNCDDIVIGTAVTSGGRLLPVHATLDGNPSFTALVDQLERSRRQAALHAQVGEGLADTLAGRMRILLMNDGEPAPAWRHDLTVSVADGGGDLGLNFIYDVASFNVAGIVSMAARMVTLLVGAGANPDCAVHQLPMLGVCEREYLLYARNATRTPFPAERSIHAVFEEVAARHPDAEALAWSDGCLNYGELNARANQLAHRLCALGVERESRVALYMERGPAMVVALLAILKAGGAYVPLEVGQPRQRLVALLDDCAPLVVLTERALADALPALAAPVLSIDEEQAALAALPTTNLAAHGGGRDLAYIMYTSGSTGAPKGVMVEHRGVLRLVIGSEYAPVAAGDCVAHCANPAFDASTWEVWSALLNGAKVQVIPQDVVFEPQRFAAALKQGGVTALWLTVGLFNGYSREIGASFGALRHLLIGGDALDPKTVRAVLEGDAAPGRLVNGYGPTETTTFATTYEIAALAADARSVPIGRPIANTRIYLLDAHGQPVPQGVVGELHIGGPGVARGYLNRPELTAERFVPDPFSADADARMFRTGDLGRILPDGNIEFIGRNDSQVKLRGFRIELGEIEARLADAGPVLEAVVTVQNERSTGKRLLAYVTAKAGHTIDPAALHRQLGESLPAYMVPAAIVVLERLPLTSNGKLDRKALPVPGADAVPAPDYVAPVGEIEIALAAIWQALLGLEQIGRNDSFLTLGGHSLLIMQLISRLTREMGVALKVRDIFDQPTLAGMALRVAGAEPPDPLVHGAIPLSPRGLPMLLSSSQQGMWFLQQFNPAAAAAYHIPMAQRLRGALDHGALRRAFDAVVARHEVLRARFSLVSGLVRQHFAPADIGFDMAFSDLSPLAGDEREAALGRLSAEEAERAFDLERGPVIRGRLVQMADDDCVLLVTMHHMVTDAWSLQVLLHEVSALYAGAQTLPALPLQFADYAEWQRDRSQGSALRPQLDFWCGHLHGAPALLDLPLDRPRPALPGHSGGHVRLTLDGDLMKGLRALSQRHGVTLFMTLLTAWAVLLSRLSGQHDVVIGTPVANRARDELRSLIGLFANALAVRVRLDGNPDVAALLAQVKDTMLAAYANHEAPFELVVEALRAPRRASHHPVFQAMLALDNTPGVRALTLPGVQATLVDSACEAAQFDLLMALSDVDGVISGRLIYAAELFDRGTMERTVEQFQLLLAGMVADEQCGVAELPLLSAAQRQMLDSFHGRVTDYPREATMHGLFEAQAARTPAALAVAHAQTALSYAELNRRANQLAHYLRAQGVDRGSLVGVCLRRSESMVVALMAILKAGGAYVALDPNYPDQRLADMVDDSDIAWMLTQRDLTERLAGHPVLGRERTALLALDVLSETLASQPETNPEPAGGSGDLAYLIYTSGSTGRPKAVRICHRNAVAMITWGGQEYSGEELRRVLCSTSLNFDLSVFELFVPLSHGGAVVVVENAMALQEGSPDITLLNTVPSACRALVDSGAIPFGVRVVNLAGEALPPALVNELIDLPQVRRVCNLYGPSEDTTYSSWISYAEKPGEAVSIGRPLDNSWFHILDAHGQLVPLGVAGEIHIGGAGVALGYLNRPELTAERFLDDPFHAGARMYRTGDLGRWREDGTIDYLGRNDFQVKLRGFRIELGEIESRLSACEGVSAAVVTAPGQQRLVAYLTPAHASGLTGQGEAELVAGVRAALKSALPDYMQPSAYVVLPALPLTANGKVDRQALPAPRDTGTGLAHVPPATQLEELVATIWEQQLGVSTVGVEDDFFALGGHSLLAVRIMLKLSAIMAVSLPLPEFFAAPTVRGLAQAFERVCGGAGIAADIVAIYRIVRDMPETEVADLIAEYG